MSKDIHSNNVSFLSSHIPNVRVNPIVYSVHIFAKTHCVLFCPVLQPNVWKFAMVLARCCPLYLPSCHSWRIKMTTVGLLGTTEHTTVPWEYCLMCNTSKRHDNKVKHWTKTIFCVLLHFMTVPQWSILDRKFSTSTMPVLMKVGWRIRHIILPIYLKWIWSWVFRVENRPILVESNSLKLEFKLILCNPRFLLDS